MYLKCSNSLTVRSGQAIAAQPGARRLTVEGHAIDSAAQVIADVHGAVLTEGEIHWAAPVLARHEPAGHRQLGALLHLAGTQGDETHIGAVDRVMESRTMHGDERAVLIA